MVCLLPLTPQTQGILNKQTLSQLPIGAYVVNAARGAHLVDADLLELLDAGHLSGACLDVFHVEPLPEEYPFWHHSKVLITPHVASLTVPSSVAPQIVENYRRLKAGEPLLNLVDLNQGY